jgi:hypothetical protein
MTSRPLVRSSTLKKTNIRLILRLSPLPTNNMASLSLSMTRSMSMFRPYPLLLNPPTIITRTNCLTINVITPDAPFADSTLILWPSWNLALTLFALPVLQGEVFHHRG